MADGDPNVGDLSGLSGAITPVWGAGAPGGYGTGGLGFQDPAWTGATMRQKYAMALMQQGSQITPLRSPWQGLARGLQGILGGYLEGAAESQMRDVATSMQERVAPSQTVAQQALSGLFGGGGGAAPTTQTMAMRATGGGMGTPAKAEDIAALPEIKALPIGYQPAIAQIAAARGMSTAEAAYWGRVLKQESGGNNIDPKTNDVIVNAKSGATGIGQLMPDTFTAMAKKYGIQGDIRDPIANLTASAAYLHEGFKATNGDPAGAGVYYNAGPGRLQDYILGRDLPAETTAYLASTGATPGKMTTASAPSGVASGGGMIAPGAGLKAALTLYQEAGKLAQDPLNPYAQRYAQYLLQTAAAVRSLGDMTPPVPIPGTNLATQTRVGTGEQVTVGQQLSGESIAGKAISELQRISRIPADQRTDQDNQDYEFHYQQLQNQGRWQLTDSGYAYEPPPALSQFQRPGAVPRPGATTTAAPPPGPGQPTPPPTVTAPPDVTTVTPPALTKAVTAQIAADQDQANTFSAKAQQNAGDLQTTAQIRSIAEHVPTNIAAAIQGQMARILSGLGADPDTVKTITQGVGASDAEVLQKLFTQLSARQTGALGGGFEVLRNFESRFPDVTSRPDSIKEFTQSLDYQIRYDQRRAELMHQWIEKNRGNLTGYKSIGSPEFNAFAQANGLDPRLYGAAAMAAAGQPYGTYARGLDTAAGEDRKAARLAWQFNPNIQIIGPDGRPHSRPSSMMGGQ